MPCQTNLSLWSIKNYFSSAFLQQGGALKQRGTNMRFKNSARVKHLVYLPNRPVQKKNGCLAAAIFTAVCVAAALGQGKKF
jgi:hypothetical protein